MNIKQSLLSTVISLKLSTKIALLIFACIAILASCAQTPPYITQCNQPACEMVAIYTSSSYQELEGIKVLASPAIEFIINNDDIEKMSEQGNVFSVEFKNEKRMSTAILSLEDIGIAQEDVEIDSFIKSAFLKKFSTLKDEKLSDALLHSTWGFKITSLESDQVFYFNREPLTVFYYPIKSSVFLGEMYQIIVVDERDKKQATVIDLYKFNDVDVKKFISTIKSYDY